MAKLRFLTSLPALTVCTLLALVPPLQPASAQGQRVIVVKKKPARKAAGAQEAIYSILMMNNGFICESANIETLDPAFADMPIMRVRRDDAKLCCVLSNSFGFGGTNASVVLKRLDA